MSRKLIFVLGVHRSGTSVTTAALQALGCTLGPFDDFRHEENPDGFFEHPAFRDLNDRMLAALGSAWDDWGLHAAEVSRLLPALDPFRAEAQRLLGTAFPGIRPVALKDPRITQLWPFWRREAAEAGFDPQALLVLRHPDEMVQSQLRRAARNRAFHPILGQAEPVAAFWAVALTGLLATPPVRMFLLRHIDLMTNAEAALDAVTRAFALEGPPEDRATFLQSGIKPAFWRERTEHPATGEGWTGLARRLHARLIAGGGNRWLDDAAAQAILKSEPGALAQFPYLGAVRATVAHARDLARDLARTPSSQSNAASALHRVSVSVMSKATDALLLDLDERMADLPAAGDSADTALLRARAAEAAGRLQDAEAMYLRLQTLSPTRIGVWVRRLSVLRALGRTPEAEALRAEAAGRFPDSPAFRP